MSHTICKKILSFFLLSFQWYDYRFVPDPCIIVWPKFKSSCDARWWWLTSWPPWLLAWVRVLACVTTQHHPALIITPLNYSHFHLIITTSEISHHLVLSCVAYWPQSSNFVGWLSFSHSFHIWSAKTCHISSRQKNDCKFYESSNFLELAPSEDRAEGIESGKRELPNQCSL